MFTGSYELNDLIHQNSVRRDKGRVNSRKKMVFSVDYKTNYDPKLIVNKRSEKEAV